MAMTETLYFLCDRKVENYLDNDQDHLPGKDVIGYMFWILRNYGVTNVKMVTDARSLDKDSVVFFHGDNIHLISTKKVRAVQFVSDRPKVEGCFLYLFCNPSFFSGEVFPEVARRVGIKNAMGIALQPNYRYVLHPFSNGIIKCTPSFPPKIFGFSGREHTIDPEFLKPSFIKKAAENEIQLQLRFDLDRNTGNEDVWFCVRNNKYVSNSGYNLDGEGGHKHPGRLYQAWYMGVPSIFNSSSEMLSLKESKLDFLVADNSEEFIEKASLLKNDRDLFFGMIDNSKRRSDEGSNLAMISSLIEALSPEGIHLNRVV